MVPSPKAVVASRGWGLKNGMDAMSIPFIFEVRSSPPLRGGVGGGALRNYIITFLVTVWPAEAARTMTTPL